MSGHLRAILIILGVFALAALAAWVIVALAGEEFSFEGGGGSLIYLLALLALVSSGLLLGRELGLKPVLKATIFWVGLGLVLLLLYSYRAEFTHLWDRIVGEIDPAQGVQVSEETVRFSAARDGHFYVDGRANGQPVRFLVDTGASLTVLGRRDAEAAGIPVGRLNFGGTVRTANGPVAAASTRLDSLEIAGRRFENELVLVLDNAMDFSVLGVSTLRRFRSYQITGDQLIIRR